MKLRPLAMIALAVLFSTTAVSAWAAPKPPFPLPPLLLPPLPDVKHLVPIPRTELYFVPDVDADLVFFDGFWWTLRDGSWYRARDHRREFIPVPRAYVPAPLSKLRPDFRHRYRHERRVPYGEWRNRHWRPEWDRERHDEWEHRRDDDRRDDDHRRDDRHDRGRHEGRDGDERGRGRD